MPVSTTWEPARRQALQFGENPARLDAALRPRANGTCRR
jgi:hypothetical protein